MTTQTKTITLYAQPYDRDKAGFYFHDYDEYVKGTKQSGAEEFEIQVIDGDGLDCELLNAVGVDQSNLESAFDAIESWDDDDKIKAIIAAECGYKVDLREPKDWGIDLYEGVTFKDLAYEFVDEGLFGEIPDSIANYIDYDAIARDLEIEYGEITIDGKHYICRMD